MMFISRERAFDNALYAGIYWQDGSCHKLSKEEWEILGKDLPLIGKIEAIDLPMKEGCGVFELVVYTTTFKDFERSSKSESGFFSSASQALDWLLNRIPDWDSVGKETALQQFSKVVASWLNNHEAEERFIYSCDGVDESNGEPRWGTRFTIEGKVFPLKED